METKKRSVNNTLVLSSIVFSFAVCFMALIHVEIELHAHRKMLRVLTQQKEENVHLRGKETKKPIASALCSDTGKGEYFCYFTTGSLILAGQEFCCFTMDLSVKTSSIPQQRPQ